MTQYRLKDNVPDDVQRELSAFTPILQKLLYYRGIKTKEAAELFLYPDWERDQGDPFEIAGMDEAVERIFKAIDAKEKIVIYGDYDADGIPGSVVLHDFFKKIGYEHFSNYIPHRHDEGYGLNTDAIQGFIDEGVTLMITVDCGITDFDEVAVAQKGGVDVIVTDHHLPIVEDGKDVLPKAFCVINSKRQDDTYHDDMLCGAGVAFKLVQALLVRGREENRFADIPVGWEKWLLDMAGLSTIADMVPLQKENRALAHFGLTVLRKSGRLGLTTLLQKLRIQQQHLTEDDIGFMLVPRINAASRMDHPLRAFELLATDDPAEAEKLADHLNHINDQRKGHVAAIMKDAHKRLAERELLSVIVIGDPEWNPGILGLVANKLVEEYMRPAFVWGYDNSGNIKGSCRGVGSVSLVDLMRSLPEETFLDTGGHFDAGGFSIDHAHIHALEEQLSAAYDAMDAAAADTVVDVDESLGIDDVHWGLFREIDKLAPFGMGNEKPIFIFEKVVIDEVRHFGKEKNHLGVDFRTSMGKKVSAIGFFMTADTFSDVVVQKGEKINLIGVIEKSMFRNIPELRIRIEKIFPSS
jgi:single-stranded-DNA-specific exonuclease